jgi:hypothetical protein
MACEDLVGVKNILLTFTDCDTLESYGPISHQLASEDLPTVRACGFTNEALPGGFVKRVLSYAQMEMNIIRDTRIPIAYYQGCAAVDVQIEYYNGLVYTGIGGSGTGDDMSDGHEVTLTLAFKEIDELLPAGLLDATAVPVAA